MTITQVITVQLWSNWVCGGLQWDSPCQYTSMQISWMRLTAWRPNALSVLYIVLSPFQYATLFTILYSRKRARIRKRDIVEDNWKTVTAKFQNLCHNDTDYPSSSECWNYCIRYTPRVPKWHTFSMVAYLQRRTARRVVALSAHPTINLCTWFASRPSPPSIHWILTSVSKRPKRLKRY